MTGDLNMLGNSITRMGDPVRHRDVVHKRCVDTHTVNQNVSGMLGN